MAEIFKVTESSIMRQGQASNENESYPPVKEKAKTESTVWQCTLMMMMMIMQCNISFLLQKGEFKKAEQMLHIALKLAQEQQNYDGVTYIYDLLANLAYEQGEYGKAEKLFLSVMQRLLSVGVPKTDNKVIHISLKLSNIYKIQKDTRYIE